jgi:hypothetical protein
LAGTEIWIWVLDKVVRDGSASRRIRLPAEVPNPGGVPREATTVRQVEGGAGGGADGDPGRFERWLAELRVDEAARSRARRHWLRSAAEEDATLAGVLLDLAERAATVAVVTTTGRRHHGRLVTVGADVVVVRSDAARHLVLRLAAVSSVRAVSEPVAPVGARSLRSAHRFVDVLVALAAERLDASLLLGNGEVVTGEVRSVGQDVAVVRGGDREPTVTYVALDAIEALALDGPLGTR